MAKEKQMIVIKKITVAGAGHHGGSWKVALADFMTAMMAFFLVMWLLSQSAETKKAVSDYFSNPSIIEYNYQNFGVELTLEKLFLDLVNEPLKAFESFMEPADLTPNILDSGSAKIVSAYIADQLTDIAKNVTMSQDGFDFDIPDNMLFEPGTSKPSKEFVNIMEKIKVITTGLEDSNVQVTTMMFLQSVPSQKPDEAQKVANERTDLLTKKIESGLEHNTNNVSGSINIKEKKGEIDPSKLIGLIRLSVHQKEVKSNGLKPRKLEAMFGASSTDMNVYDNFVHQITNKNKKSSGKESKNLPKQQ